MPAEHPLEGLGSPQGCTEQLSCPQEVPEFGCCTREGLASEGRLKCPVQPPAQSRAVVHLQAMLRQGGISKGRQPPPSAPGLSHPPGQGAFPFHNLHPSSEGPPQATWHH